MFTPERNLVQGNSILEQLKCQNCKDIFASPLVHFWKEDTLKCSGANLLKVSCVVNGRERLPIFAQ